MNTIALGMAPLAFVLPGVMAPTETNGLFISQLENVLGTSLTLKLVASSYAAARQAEATILAEIDRLTSVFSSYDPTSEFSRWQQTPGRAVPVSADLGAVLSLFDTWQARTGGAINAAAEQLNRLWQQAAQHRSHPSANDLREAITRVAQPHWQLDRASQTATRLSQTPLRLHTFTKSYVLDRASEAALALPGVEAVVLNGGGDLIIRGNWTEPVTVANPRADAENSPAMARLLVDNRAVATSGSYRRGVRLNNEWFSHLIDPRTGLPAGEVLSATVVHPDAVVAGALATAFAIVPPAERIALAASNPDADYLIVPRRGESVTSPGWNNLLAPLARGASGLSTARLLSVPQKDKLWNPTQELLISLVLPQPEGRAHRPFVAVWVEDEKHVPVRQLALWYNKPRWLHELRAWYGLHTDDAASVTSATRSPGSYTLSWDGKDDRGQYVKQGKYTICIEAAREHGTYQLMRQEMDFNGKTKQQTLNGNVEIESAALDYREKTSLR